MLQRSRPGWVPRRWRVGSAVLLFACAVVASVGVQASASAPAVGSQDARAWLMRIHDAASKHNFQGTFIVSSAVGVQSARIAHYCDGKNQFERIESLDGKARNVFRHNDVVHTFWPGSHVAMVEQRGLLNSFPALLQASDSGIDEFYEVRVEGVARMAGHETDVLSVRARDAYRYGYRLWADKATSLLLRVDVLGERGEVLETSAFSDVAIDIRFQPDTVLQAMKRLDGYRVLRPVMKPASVDREGWSMRQMVPGFRQVSSVVRQMQSSADTESEPSASVLQVIYSDGLTYVSVFIEPYRPARDKPMTASIGATQTLSQRRGDSWLTVVGDTPAGTLRLFANGLERRK